MGNCQTLPCTTADADKKKKGSEEVVEEVETLQEQKSAKSGKLVSVSASKAASRKRSTRSSKSSRQSSTKEPMMASAPSEVSSMKVGSTVSESTADGAEDDVNVALKAVGSSVDLELTTGDAEGEDGELDEEEEEEEEEEDTGMMTKAYLTVFDTLFNAMLFMLSSAAALLHMLTRPQAAPALDASGVAAYFQQLVGTLKAQMQWPDVMPISRIATMRFGSFAAEPAVEPAEALKEE